MSLQGDRHRWWTLVAVCGATFMLLVDVTIVQVALPTIQREMHASFSDLQWVIDAYAVSLAALILTSGSLADHYGRKRVFLGGVGIFTIASALCGAAANPGMLLASRAFQGIGGAAMFATSLALIGQEFSGRERATAIAAWSATVGGAVAIGPLVGGALTSGVGWRWIFYVNVPIGIVTFILTTVKTVNVRDPGALSLDWGGLVTFSGSLFLFVFGLVRGELAGWSNPVVLAMFTSAAALLVAFVMVELRHPRPMFDLSLFRKRSFTGVSISTFLIGAGTFALLPFLTFYFQNYLGASPLVGGEYLLPSTMLAFIVPLATRRMTEAMPPAVALSGGLGLTAIGVLLMSGLSIHSNWTALVPGMIVFGTGIGLANPAIAKIGLGVVDPRRSGMASGLSNTFRIGGLATGIAGLGAFFQDRLAARLAPAAGSASSHLADVVASGGIRAAASASHRNPGIIAASRHAFVLGMNDLFILGAVIAGVAAVVGLAMVRNHDFVTAVPTAAREQAAPSASAELV
ncbi:MAG: MFS transporter [Actinomycetota bacterium]|nr:MFS transporter [Actinomycetota bacterium]